MVCVTLYIPIWEEDGKRRAGEARVKELVSVGDDIFVADRYLRDAGFRVSGDGPHDPFGDGDSFWLNVRVGERGPNSAESLAYAGDFPWMPFTHSESGWVVLEADADGKIRSIE